MIWMILSVGLANAQGKKNNKVQPFMGGWGVSAQSTLIPLNYPQSFPKIKADGVQTPNFQQAGQDVGLGIKGTLFASRKYRASVNPYYHMGFNDSNYRAFGVNLEVDQMAFRERNVWGYYGLGGGTSNLKFIAPDESTLTATQLYLKGQVGALYFDRTKAYELSLYATFGSTGREQITKDGVVYENQGVLGDADQLKGSLYYPTIGVQGTVYKGDFRKAMKTQKKKKKKKQKKNKK